MTTQNVKGVVHSKMERAERSTQGERKEQWWIKYGICLAFRFNRISFIRLL